MKILPGTDKYWAREDGVDSKSLWSWKSEACNITSPLSWWQLTKDFCRKIALPIFEFLFDCPQNVNAMGTRTLVFTASAGQHPSARTACAIAWVRTAENVRAASTETHRSLLLWRVLVSSCLFCCMVQACCTEMGPVRIRHSSHDFGWQSGHSVDLAGWQAKMASIEIWMPWRYAHKPHWHGELARCGGEAQIPHFIWSMLKLILRLTCWGFFPRDLKYSVHWTKGRFSTRNSAQHSELVTHSGGTLLNFLQSVSRKSDLQRS